MGSISVPAAIIGGAALAGGASIASGALGAGAASSAAQTQANAANNATAAEQAQFNTTQQNEAPFIGAGQNALAILQQQLGLSGGGSTPASFNPNAPLVAPFNPATYSMSPGAQFQTQAGINAVQNSAAAGGGVVSGNTLRALQSNGQGIANQDYWNAYNAYNQNQNNIFNKLNSVVGTGSNAVNQLGGFGANVAGQIGSNIIGAGNAQAAGTVGSASAIAGGINGVGSSASNLGQNYLTMGLMQQLFGNGGGFGGYGGGGASYPYSGPNSNGNIG